MINKLIDYQTLDAQKLKLEKELEASENRRQVNLMAQFVKDATEKSKQLNIDAGKLVEELEKIQEIKVKGVSLVEKLLKEDISSLEEEELKELDQKITKATYSLRELEKKITLHLEKIKAVLLDFENTRKKVFIARQKHKENKDLYDSLVAKIEPKIKEIDLKLKEKQKQLDKNLFKKYEDARKDGLFPIVVKLNNNSCGGCSTQLPSGTLDKIKEEGHLRCENCRRLIYLD